MNNALLLNVMTSLALLVCAIDKDGHYSSHHSGDYTFTGYYISDMGNCSLLIALSCSVISTVMLANESRRQQKKHLSGKINESD